MNFKNCVYISWKIQILTILRHKITQIFTKKYYLLSKSSKIHNLETYFCELLRPRAPPFQKIKWNPWNLVTTLQKSCFLGPTILEVPQPNWYYYWYTCSATPHRAWAARTAGMHHALVQRSVPCHRGCLEHTALWIYCE